MHAEGFLATRIAPLLNLPEIRMTDTKGCRLVLTTRPVTNNAHGGMSIQPLVHQVALMPTVVYLNQRMNNPHLSRFVVVLPVLQTMPNIHIGIAQNHPDESTPYRFVHLSPFRASSPEINHDHLVSEPSPVRGLGC